MRYDVTVFDGADTARATMNQDQLLNFLVAHLDTKPDFKMVQDILDDLSKGKATTFHSDNICTLYRLVKVIPQ